MMDAVNAWRRESAPSVKMLNFTWIITFVAVADYLMVSVRSAQAIKNVKSVYRNHTTSIQLITLAFPATLPSMAAWNAQTQTPVPTALIHTFSILTTNARSATQSCLIANPAQELMSAPTAKITTTSVQVHAKTAVFSSLTAVSVRISTPARLVRTSLCWMWIRSANFVRKSW